MKTFGHIPLSSCCSYRISTCPASFGDPTMSFCNKCNTQCNVVWTEIQAYEKITKGQYRKIDNSKIGY